MDRMKVLSVTLMALLTLLLSVANATVYHIKPISDNRNCSEPCYTMQEYVSQMSDSMASNITLILLSGNHSLESMVTFRNLSYLEFIVNTPSFSDFDVHLESTGLVCTSSGRLTIETVNEVYISGLSLYGCTQTIISEVSQFTMEDSTIQLYNLLNIHMPYLDLQSIQNASLTRTSFIAGSTRIYSNVVSVYNSSLVLSECVTSNFEIRSSQSLLYASNSSVWIEYSSFSFIRIHSSSSIVHAQYSNVTVMNTSFSDGVVVCCSSIHQLIQIESSSLIIYNASISNWFSTSSSYRIQAIEATRSTIDISNSIFTNNSYNTGVRVSNSVIQIRFSIFSMSTGSGPLVSVSNSEATLEGVEFENNSITCIQASESTLTIQNNSIFVNNTQTVLTISDCTMVSIYSCVFSTNTQSNGYNSGDGAVNVHRTLLLTVRNTTFGGRMGHSGRAVYAYESTVNLMQNTVTDHKNALMIQNSNVSVTNCTFTNNTALGGSGGCIDTSNSNVSVVASLFEQNVAYGHGGAIYAWRCTMDFADCTFSNNVANNSYYDGGALHASESNISLSSCTFQDNIADEDGGAIYLSNVALASEFTIFDGNSVIRNDGGAIKVRGSSNISLSECTFHNNTAGDDGGAVDTDGGIVTFSYCTFLNNTAGDEGGAFDTDRSTVTFSYCTFLSNTASHNGGAFSADRETAAIHFCTFENNIANNQGGAMSIWNASASIYHTTFIRNLARSNDGGAFKFGDSSIGLTLLNCSFLNNTAGAHGGAVKSYEASITLSSCLFQENSAMRNGGALDASNGTFIVSSSTFHNNTASEYGGAIDISRSQSTIIRNCTFTSNSAGRGGGSVDIGESTSNITSSIFNNNRAGRSGGGVGCWRCNVFAVNFSIFSNNLAIENGGGLNAGRGIFIVNHNMFFNNTSGRNGGSVKLNEGDITIKNNSFFSSRAYRYGGSVNIDESTANLSTCRFEGNMAGRDGGGLNSWRSNISIVNCKFLHNQAKESGGGSYVSNSFNDLMVTVSNNTFFNNTCGRYGGGLAAGNGNITIRNNSFIQNQAGIDGGGINSWRAMVKIELVMFGYNAAKQSGGAVNLYSCMFSISNCLLSNNTAIELHGGSISLYGNSTPVVVQDTVIENSVAGHSGGGLQAGDGDLSITNVVFRNNTAHLEGGAIDTGIATLVSVHNSSFISNRASLHGGALNTGLTHSLLITSSVFESNTAEGRGGVIKAYSESISIVDSQFISNRALYSGGILDTVRSSVRMSDCEFINNAANKDGGIANVVESSITVDNCYFEGNAAHRDGGVVEATDSIVFLESSTLVNNTATSRDGGVIGALESNVTIRNSTLVGNRAGRDGGVCQVADSMVVIVNSSISGSRAEGRDGGMIDTLHSNITIDNSDLNNSTAGRDGGVAFVSHSSLKFINSVLSNNSATRNGGAIMSESSVVMSRENVFEGNEGGWGGGIFSEESNTTLINDTYTSNTAHYNGGGIHSLNSTLTITNNSFRTNLAHKGGTLFISHGSTRTAGSMFSYNSASYGAAFAALNSSIDTENNVFANNFAHLDAGGLLIDSSTVSLVNETFINNSAMNKAGVLISTNSQLTIRDIHAETNMANLSNIFTDMCVLIFSGAKHFINNTGSILITNSNVSFQDETIFINGRVDDYIEDQILREGGALSAYDSHIVLSDTLTMRNNQARYGGAILATRSTIEISAYAQAQFFSNQAIVSGGVFYLEQSEVNFMGNVSISNNAAQQKGGGILAISSLINLARGSLQFTENDANMGGAIALEHYSKVNVIKRYSDIDPDIGHTPFILLNFKRNVAVYGGAIYVSDSTTPDTCTSTSFSPSSKTNDCFLQVLLTVPISTSSLSTRIFFSDNAARVAGSALYGGLLDRCTVNPLAEIFHQHRGLTRLDGGSYIRNITNISLDSISSGPVRLCFCNHNGIPDCDSDIPVLSATRGDFHVSAAAIDHMNNIQSANVFTSIIHHSNSLPDEMDNQTLSGECTQLQYSDFHDSVLLSLHANGPCNNLGISKNFVAILVDSNHTANTGDFTSSCTLSGCDKICPIGFVNQSSSISRTCDCVCDPALKPYITNCSSETGILLREGDFWLDYTNSTEPAGFIIHENCPLDYCHPSTKQISINFDTPLLNGADAQCNHNRSGMLCGECAKLLSVTLGSSKCASCSNHSLALLIPFALLGVALVALIVVCNLTVAVGTLNAIVLYANIVIAHSYIFLPNVKPNYIKIFIAWMSLDFGVDACFYDGMDAYAKAWLQFVFPLYLIVLTVLAAAISRYSKRMSKILSREHLINLSATILFLSFMKLTRVIMVVLSFTRITLPDDSYQTLWLYDPTVAYLNGRHKSIFVVAVCIGVVLVSFAGLLFCGPWLLNRSASFKHKTIKSFMSTYYTPYNSRHQYWFGLLLFFQLIICLVSAMNSTGSSNIVLLSIIIITGFFVLVKIIINDRVYVNWVLDTLESIVLFDLIVFASATLYVRTTTGDQAVVAHLCVTILIIAFLLVLVYHTHEYLLKKFKLWKTMKTLAAANFTLRKHQAVCNNSGLPPEDIASRCSNSEEIEIVKLPLDPDKEMPKLTFDQNITNEQL